MAMFRTHITFSSALGIVYGGAAWTYLGFEPGAAILAGGLTAVGGMLPDLDSDSGIPVRETFGLAAAVIPLLFVRRLMHMGLSTEGIFAGMAAMYLFIRYGVSRLFRQLTVHRGMFHSIPAMLIAGLVVYLGYHHPDVRVRYLLACGVMIGFFSHLLLDEIWAVDFRGLVPKLNQFAGSAIKLGSKSWAATATTYGLLFALAYVAFEEYQQRTGVQFQMVETQTQGKAASIPRWKW